MQIVIEDHLQLVNFVISREFSNSYLEYDDLFQIGSIGLWKAAKTYDETKGQFSTYAYIYIKTNILTAIRDLKCKLDIAISLDDCVPEMDKTYAEIIPGNSENVETFAINEACISKWLKAMSKQDKQIVLLSRDGLNQREIAKIMGCSQPQVGRRLKAQLAKYRWMTRT